MPTKKGKLVGSRFHPPAEKALMFAGRAAGVPVLLKREPDNQFDKNAIRVLVPQSAFRESHREQLRASVADLPDPFSLGFIDRDSAALLAPPLDAMGGEAPAEIDFATCLVTVDVPAGFGERE
jgi:hypothetical protein